MFCSWDRHWNCRADGMNWGEKWDKATNSAWLCKWEESGALELWWKCQAWQIQNYVSLQHHYEIPRDFTVTYKTMNNCSTEEFYNTCNILTCIFHIHFKNSCLLSHQVRIRYGCMSWNTALLLYLNKQLSQTGIQKGVCLCMEMWYAVCLISCL